MLVWLHRWAQFGLFVNTLGWTYGTASAGHRRIELQATRWVRPWKKKHTQNDGCFCRQIKLKGNFQYSTHCVGGECDARL